MKKLGTILYNNRYLIGVVFFAVITFFIIISALNGVMNGYLVSDSETAKELAKVENDKLEVHTSDDKYISVDTAKENKNIINEFVEALNNQEYEKAWDYLSDNCKQEVFMNNANNFLQYYVSRYVPEKRIIGLDLYKKYKDKDIYKVSFHEDALSNGKVQTAKNSDYIVVDEKEKKIGVNGFIEKFEINKSEEYNNVKIEVLTRSMYVEKEEIRVKVTNNKQDKKIHLVRTTDAYSICLQKENGAKTAASQSEIKPYYLDYEPGQEQEFTIKFNQRINTGNPVKRLVFSGIIEDYEIYQQTRQLDTTLTIAINI